MSLTLTIHAAVVEELHYLLSAPENTIGVLSVMAMSQDS